MRSCDAFVTQNQNYPVQVTVRVATSCALEIQKKESGEDALRRLFKKTLDSLDHFPVSRGRSDAVLKEGVSCLAG